MTEYLDADALAERLHCSRATAVRLITTRRVPVLKVGRLRVVPSEALDRWALDHAEYPRDRAEAGPVVDASKRDAVDVVERMIG